MKHLLVLLLIVMCIASASAVVDVGVGDSTLQGSTNGIVISPSSIDATALNQSRQIAISLFNSSTGMPLSSPMSCYAHVYDQTTGNLLGLNYTPLKSNNIYTFVFPPSNFSYKGFDYYIAWCNTSDTGGFAHEAFLVTQSGNLPADDFFEILIYLLFIGATLGLFVTLFLTIANIVTQSETIFSVIITWSFVVLMIIVNYLGREYLIRTFVESLSSTFITITIWSNGVLPLISLIITMFVKGTQKKRPLSVQEISGRFISRG